MSYQVLLREHVKPTGLPTANVLPSWRNTLIGNALHTSVLRPTSTTVAAK